jgi:Protein of unknown function (DUF3128)
MSDDEKPRHFVIPPCYQIFDKAWFCVTPMNQISQVYKTGEVEDCSGILTDWTLCIQAKAYFKEADKQVCRLWANIIHQHFASDD